MARREKIELSRHHRRPKSLGGDNSPRNISNIPVHRHRAWHCIAQNHEPVTIAQIINSTYLDPDYKLVALRNEQLQMALNIVERAERLLKRKYAKKNNS